MYKPNKLCLLLLTSVLFSACETEETVTEISGKVTDIETSTPVADAKLNLTVADAIDREHNFVNPVYYSTTSNTEGQYTFIFPEKKQQQLFLVTPEKTGYVEVREPNSISTMLKAGEKNQQDIYVAQGSYLNLNIRQTPSNTDKRLNLTLSYTVNSKNPSPSGVPLISETIAVDARTTDTIISRGFYFEHTSKINLSWEVTTMGAEGKTERFNETIDLKEHDTINFEINY